MADIRDSDIPQFARRCWEQFQSATQKQRDREKESLGFWIGGTHQWRAGETQAREGKQLPWLTINRCKPAVDQVENEARNNPPGPQCHPVGGGADSDGADIMAGLIREYEYRSMAHTAYVTALRYATAGGSGAFEMGTEFVSDRSMEQQIVIKEIEDPSTVFYDTEAKRPSREDAMWQGRIRVLSEEQLEAEFPDSSLKILNRSLVASAGTAMGWMQSAVGYRGDYATVNTWTNGGRGPYFVCEFYRVAIENKKLTLYDDGILRFDDEDVPADVDPKESADGQVTFRNVPIRRVWKHIVTALDHIKKTEWYGSIIPIFWVMGPELYRDNELTRLSLISTAQDAQRGLNYAATSAAVVVGNMTKAPWIGWEGQFDVINAQGFNPWEATNSTNWAYLEVKPTWAVHPGSGEATLLPAPQRNSWEAPIQRLLELASWYGEQIKAATSIFFDPTQQSVNEVQSGKAIQALQSQTNIGTLNWQDALHMAVQKSYNQAAIILPRILDGERVKTIVRPGNKHEIVTINQEFPAEEMHPSGKHQRKDGTLEPTNSITLGRYAVRVTAGADNQTDSDQAVQDVTQAIKFMPGVLQNPKVGAQFLRWVGDGDPEIEALCDLISPPTQNGATPEQMQQQLQQAQQQLQSQGVVIQKLYAEIKAKLPQIEADKWKTAIEALVKIRVAEITASKDADSQQANIAGSAFEKLAGIMSDHALQEKEQAHQQGMAEKQAAIQSAQSAQDAAQQPQEEVE